MKGYKFGFAKLVKLIHRQKLSQVRKANLQPLTVRAANWVMPHGGGAIKREVPLSFWGTNRCAVQRTYNMAMFPYYVWERPIIMERCTNTGCRLLLSNTIPFGAQGHSPGIFLFHISFDAKRNMAGFGGGTPKKFAEANLLSYSEYPL